MMAKTSLTVAAFSAALLGAGAAHAQRFIDNGDGTLTDRQSGLMWEKKTSTGGGVHDVSGRYTWCIGADFTCANRTRPYVRG